MRHPTNSMPVALYDGTGALFALVSREESNCRKTALNSDKMEIQRPKQMFIFTSLWQHHSGGSHNTSQQSPREFQPEWKTPEGGSCDWCLHLDELIFCLDNIFLQLHDIPALHVCAYCVLLDLFKQLRNHMFSTFLRLFFLEYLHCFHIRAHYCWVDNVDKGAAARNKMFDFSFLIRNVIIWYYDNY